MKNFRQTAIGAAAIAFLLCVSGCNDGGSKPAPAPILYQGKAFSAWLAQAEEERGEPRLQAVRAIGAMGPEGGREVKAAVSTLLTAFQDPWCRAAAALSLANFGPDARAAVPALVRALRDEDLEVRTGAATALEKIGPDSIAQLVAAVESWEERPPFYGEEGTWFDELVRVNPQLVVVALVVIALAGLLALYQGFKLWTRHRERLARIEKGLDPETAGSPPKGLAA